jgi:hypothetical protein
VGDEDRDSDTSKRSTRLRTATARQALNAQRRIRRGHARFDVNEIAGFVLRAFNT